MILILYDFPQVLLICGCIKQREKQAGVIGEFSDSFLRKHFRPAPEFKLHFIQLAVKTVVAH
jgi:hypothetical protein